MRYWPITLILLLTHCWLHPVYQIPEDSSAADPFILLAIFAGVGNNAGTTRTFKYIFVTDVLLRGGDVMGKDGADGHCQADARKPGSGTYKALLGDANNRYWCRSDMDTCPGGTSLDWVLAPDTEYRQTDGTTLIANSDAFARFVFPISNPYSNDLDTAWTGLAPNMSSNAGTSECGNWLNFGCCGNHITLTNTTSINEGNRNCNLTSRLICVEQ